MHYSASKVASQQGGLLAALWHPDALRIENSITEDFIYKSLFPVVLHRNAYLMLCEPTPPRPLAASTPSCGHVCTRAALRWHQFEVAACHS